MNHLESVCSLNGTSWLVHSLVLELLFNLLTLFHKQLKEVITLLLHILLIFIYEEWFHNQFVKAVKVFGTTPILPWFSLVQVLGLVFLIWMYHCLVSTDTIIIVVFTLVIALFTLISFLFDIVIVIFGFLALFTLAFRTNLLKVILT